MRIFPIVFIFFLFFWQNLFCQNWYSGINLGYSLGTASQNISSNVVLDPNKTTNEVVKGSFGKGLSASCYLGYWLRENIGFEIGLSYLNGTKYKGSFIKDTLYKQNISVSAKMFRIIPAVRIWLHKEDKKCSAYIKLGLAAMVVGSITNESEYVDIQSNTTTISEMKYTKGMSIGFLGGAGFCYKLTPKISAFSELLFISQSWAPKNGDMMQYSVNGIDQLNVLSSSQKHIHFSDKYTSSNSSQSNSVPSQQLKQYHNFSSIGLNVGIQFVLGKGN